MKKFIEKVKSLFAKFGRAVKGFFTSKDVRLALLYMLFAAALVGANCVAAKQIPVGTWFGVPVSITVGILFYPFTFLITDIIGENYGRRAANKAVIGGFIGQIAVILIVLICNALPGTNKEEFNTLLGGNWILTCGSLLACIVSQTWDVFIFHKLRDNYIRKHGSTKGGKWIWNNLSTTGSQLIDSTIFYIGFMIFNNTYLSQFGVPAMTAQTFFVTLFAYFVIKLGIALADTPLFYLFTMGHKDRMTVTSDHEKDTEEASVL